MVPPLFFSFLEDAPLTQINLAVHKKKGQMILKLYLQKKISNNGVDSVTN